MNKQKFNELKLKFTDGNGKYIFPVPVIEMNNEDLRDYIDYIAEKAARASYYANNGSFKNISDESNKQQKYINLLNSVKNNRPDFTLSEKELELANFKGAIQIG